MSILAKLLERGERSSGDQFSAWIDARRAGRVGSPVPSVSVDTALRHSAVWACSTFIADMIATWPWHAYRRSQGVRRQITAPIVDTPSDVVTPIVWRTQALMSVLLRGNAFGVVTAWTGLTPTRIELVSPDDVTWRKLPDGREEWKLRGQPVEQWPLGPLWHMPGYVLAGQRLGLSVIAYAAAAISLGHSAEAFGRDWFDDGAHPSGLLKFDGELSEAEATTAKERWMAKVHGSREPVTLGSRWSYEPIQILAEDSQFLETIQANDATVARFFRVPPEIIGSSSGTHSVTYANVEQRHLSVLQVTLGPWTRRLEEALSALLPRQQYARANVDAFLRTDARTSSEVMDRELRNGLLQLNEGRALKERPPLPGGDTHVWPPLPSPQPAATQEDPDGAA